MRSSSSSNNFSFEIKNVQLPLMSVVLKTADLQQLSADMQQRFGDTPDFFDNDPVLIDLQALDAQDGALDMPGLLALLREVINKKRRAAELRGRNKSA